ERRRRSRPALCWRFLRLVGRTIRRRADHAASSLWGRIALGGQSVQRNQQLAESWWRNQWGGGWCIEGCWRGPGSSQCRYRGRGGGCTGHGTSHADHRADARQRIGRTRHPTSLQVKARSTKAVTTSGEASDLRLYTLGERSQRTGMFGLPLRATLIAGGAFIVAMLVLMQGGLGPGALIALLAVAYLAPAIVRIGNRTLYEVAQMRFQFWRAEKAGSTIYRSGPNSRIPGGRYRLPGALAKTELHVGRDVAGNDFAMVRDQALNQYTVLLDASSRGQEPLTVTDRN